LNTPPKPPLNKAHVIARNSFWYGIELAYSLLGALLTSILVARAIGPVKLSYFNFVVYLTNTTAALSGFGIQTMARKYMAEYLNRGDRDVARAIYLAALRIQIWTASGATAVGLALVYWFGEAGYHVIEALLVLNVGPRMIGFIPSQANNADEAMKRNTGPAILGGVVTTVVTLVSLAVGWGLTGVAAATMLGPVLETALKLRSVERWLGSVAPAPIPAELKGRMKKFSGESIALMILNAVVWDRSDIFFLKLLNHDPRQITFFSMAFNLTERLLMMPSVFAQSVAATMMAQYGRGKEELRRLTITSARYSFLMCLPLLAGMACISGPLVALAYGPAYIPMGRVLAIVSLMAIPKALMASPSSLLQAMERQRQLILWGCVGGAIDFTLDFLLVPTHGAQGAALANGIGQAVAAFGIWFSAWQAGRLDLQFGGFARIAGAGVAMAAAVVGVRRLLPGYAGLALAVAVGALVWMIALRVSRALDRVDASRLLAVGKVFPARLRPFWTRVVGLVASPQAT